MEFNELHTSKADSSEDASPTSVSVYESRERCDLTCPDACHVTSQPVSLSYTELAGASISNSMSEAQRQHLQTNFFKAKNTRERVEGHRFSRTIETILGVIHEFEVTQNFIASTVNNPHTSSVHRAIKATRKIYSMAEEDIDYKFFKDFSEYYSYYVQSMEGYINVMVDYFKKASLADAEYRGAIELRCRMMNTSMVDWESLGAKVDKTISDAFDQYTLFSQMGVGIYNIYHMDISHLTYSTEALSSCSQFESIKNSRHMFFKYGYNASVLESDYYLGFLYCDEGLLELTSKSIASMIECVTPYGELLDKIASWKNALHELTIQDPDESFGKEFISAFEETADFLSLQLKLYMENKIDKGTLSRRILSMDLQALIANITQNMNSFKLGSLADVKLDLKNSALILQNRYSQALLYISEFGRFVRDGRFDADVRSAQIWLHPYPVIETSKVSLMLINSVESIDLFLWLLFHSWYPSN